MENPSPKVCCQCGHEIDGDQFFKPDAGQGKSSNVICGKCYVSGKGDPRYAGHRPLSDEGAFDSDSGVVLPSQRFYRHY